MMRYFRATLVSFAGLVALALAQGQEPAPKKKAEVQKNDPAAPDAKKGDAEADKPKPREDPKKIIQQLRDDFESAREQLQKKDAGDATRKAQKKIIEGIDKLLEDPDDNNQNNAGGGGAGGGQGGAGQSGSSQSKGGDSSNSNSQGGAKNQGGAGQSTSSNPMLNDNQKKNDTAKNENKKNDNQAKKNQEKKKDEQLAKKDNQGGGGKGDAKKDDKGGGRGASGVEGKGSDTKKDNTIANLKKDIWGHLPEHRRKEMDAFARERFMPRYEEMLREYYRALAESNRRKGD